VGYKVKTKIEVTCDGCGQNHEAELKDERLEGFFFLNDTGEALAIFMDPDQDSLEDQDDDSRLACSRECMVRVLPKMLDTMRARWDADRKEEEEAVARRREARGR
jgi:hypothetical protein